VVAASAGLRLARFNLLSGGGSDVSGMPSPAMAILGVGIWVNLHISINPYLEVLGDPNFICLLSLAVAWCMNLPMRFINCASSRGMSLHQILSIVLILVFLAGLFIHWRVSVLITGVVYFLLSLLLPLFSNSPGTTHRPLP